jgi:ribose/xylose/arabinose/galactoside ABC-type transport system permease subunit
MTDPAAGLSPRAPEATAESASTTTEAAPLPIAGETVPASGTHARISHRKLFESSITGFVFVVIFAIFGLWLDGKFISVSARMLDVHQNVPVLLLALSVLVTLVPGLFDLSVSGVATLACFLTIGLRVHQGFPMWLAIIIALAIGVATGLVNGFLVERTRVNAFITTLGTGGICLGASAVYSGGTLIAPAPTGIQLPSWFTSFGSYTDTPPRWLVWAAVVLAIVALFFGVDHIRPQSWSTRRWLTVKSTGLVIVAVIAEFGFRFSHWVSNVSWLSFFLFAIAFGMWVLLEYTTFGRHLRAMGSNRSAAVLAGVNAERQVMKSFMIGGFLAALSGVVLAATQGSASPDIAGSFLLPAFAYAYLSTVVLSNGRFTVPGTIIGGIFVIWVGQGLVVGGLAATWVPIVNGIVLIAAVALSTALRRSRR